MNNEMKLFHKNYQKLRHLISQSQKVFEKLNIREESLSLKLDGSFRLLILGRNRRDRINFINSLVGREFLNTIDLSASSTSIEIKWDERERSIVHFMNEPDSSINEEDFIENDDKSEELSNRLQIEVPVSKLHKYIPLNKILNKIEIFIPDDFCMDEIEIFDIPELNGIKPGEDISEIAAGLKINLIVYIISADEIIHGEDTYKYPFKLEFGSIFYVFSNSEDISSAEKCSIIQSFKNITRFREEGIFFITDSRYDEPVCKGINGTIYEASILNVRDAINQEHKIESLYKPLYDLSRIIKEINLKIIGELYMTAEQNAQDIEMIYNRSTAAVKRAQIHRESINDRVIFFMERIKNSINEEVNNFIECLPARIEKYIKGLTEKYLRSPILDLYKKADEQVDMEIYEWIIGSIIPLIDTSIKSALREEEYSIKSFCYEIDNINRDFGRAKGVKQPAEKYISAALKFSGFLNTGKGEELKEYIKSINESLVSKVVLSRKVFVISSKYAEKVTCSDKEDMERYLEMVYSTAALCIKENSEAARNRISEEIINQIEAFFEYIKVKIDFEIERVKNKVEYLLEYKNKLQKAIDRISECERELKEIDNALIELVFETTGT